MKPKTLMLKINLAILIIALASYDAFSNWVYNYSPIVFEGGEGVVEIGGEITEGAVNFLEANGNFLDFMKQLEASGAVVKESDLMGALDRALKGLEQAQSAYLRLKETADRTPYDAAVIEKLKTFDYEGFRERRGMNPVIFAEVKGYLANGEVRELYGRVGEDAARLLESVRAVKARMEQGVILPLEETWRANDLFMKFLGSGQYAAEVFKAL